MERNHNALLRDVHALEQFGRLIALVPIHKAKAASGKFNFNIFLVVISIAVIILQSLWDWDDLTLSYFPKNSDKIHYVLFQVALWLSSTFARIAFLITTPFIHNLFAEAKGFVEKCVPPQQKRVSRFYKIICLLFLNLIYIIQTIEYLLRNLTRDSSKNELQGCNRFILPCKDSIFLLIVSFLFKIVSSSTLYYFTYFTVIMSDLFLQILESFEQKILSILEPPSKTISNTKNISLIDIPTEEVPWFIFKRKDSKCQLDKIEKPWGRKLGTIITDENENPPEDKNEESNLHEHFSMMRSLFNKFNIALGPSLIVLVFSDILMFICLVFSIVPIFAIGTEIKLPSFLSEESLKTQQEQKIFVMDVYHYIISVMFECQAILLAIIGYFLKFKIKQIQETFEQASQKCMGQDEELVIAKNVASRFGKWKWSFRALDMFSVDLSLLSTILGTVMTYVVVLLQIRLSEGGLQ